MAKSNELQPDFGFAAQTKNQLQPTTLDKAYGDWVKAKTPESTRALLGASQSILSKALMSYAGSDQSLMARAKRLALKAFQSYDPKRGTKLRTYLHIQLQPLQREYMKRTSPVNIPERVQLEQYRLDMAERTFRDEFGREPADSELADTLGLSEKRLAHVRKFRHGFLTEGQTATPESGVRLPGTEGATAEDTWIEYVHHDLDPIDKKILEWKTGIYGKDVISNNEIARRLKITPSAVTQRATKIALKIEEGR